MTFDEDPIFDENYYVHNVPNISFPTERGMSTVLYVLNEEGMPCRRQYLNDELIEDLQFVDFDSLQTYIKQEIALFGEFQEFMQEREKLFAKTIRISKKYEDE